MLVGHDHRRHHHHHDHCHHRDHHHPHEMVFIILSTDIQILCITPLSWASIPPMLQQNNIIYKCYICWWYSTFEGGSRSPLVYVGPVGWRPFERCKDMLPLSWSVEKLCTFAENWRGVEDGEKSEPFKCRLHSFVSSSSGHRWSYFGHHFSQKKKQQCSFFAEQFSINAGGPTLCTVELVARSAKLKLASRLASLFLVS